MLNSFTDCRSRPVVFSGSDIGMGSVVTAMADSWVGGAGHVARGLGELGPYERVGRAGREGAVPTWCVGG